MTIKDQMTFMPGGILKGENLPPGDKSISHRSVIFGALADGASSFKHFLDSEDCLNTLNSFKQMGVEHSLEKGCLTIKGAGLHGLKKPAASLYLGNSGTSARLLLGVLSAQNFNCGIKGDDSLSSRPMDRVVRPLSMMGAKIAGRDDAKFLPLEIEGSSLKGIYYKLPVASAQVKSCLLLAGLFAEGATEIEEPLPSRDHTERALKAFGTNYSKTGDIHRVESPNKLKAISYNIPGDISSSAFFIVGALLTPGSQIKLKRVGLNETRTGLLTVLNRMNADIKIENRVEGPEPYGDLIVTHSKLKATEVEAREIPLLIDEIPILTLAASLAEGKTIIQGAKELRFKESDRIAVMVKNLKAIGANVREKEDGFEIEGREKLKGGSIESFGDHRVAMTFAVASLASQEAILVQGAKCIETSYPKFFDDLQILKKS